MDLGTAGLGDEIGSEFAAGLKGEDLVLFAEPIEIAAGAIVIAVNPVGNVWARRCPRS